MQRCEKGSRVTKEVIEIASGLNETRPKLEKLLADISIGTIVVENRDRLTRFGSHSIETLLEAQGRHLEVIFQGDIGDELIDDFVHVITSMAALISCRRHNKRRAEKTKACVESSLDWLSQGLLLCGAIATHRYRSLV